MATSRKSKTHRRASGRKAAARPRRRHAAKPAPRPEYQGAGGIGGSGPIYDEGGWGE